MRRPKVTILCLCKYYFGLSPFQRDIIWSYKNKRGAVRGKVQQSERARHKEGAARAAGRGL